MSNSITVWYHGNALLVYKEIAEQLSIKDNQILHSESEFWTVLRLNCEFGVLLCQAEIIKEETK